MKHGLWTVAGLMMFSVGLLGAEPFVLKGSDLLGEALREAMQAEAGARGWALELDFEGSLDAVAGLEEGTVAAALVAWPEEEDGPDGFTRYPVAFQIAALAVAASNPVESLSYRELEAMFRAGATLRSWGGLADGIDWEDASISLLALRREGSMALELFSAAVLGGEAYAEEMHLLTVSDEVMANRISEQVDAIVLVPWTAAQPGTKLLAVAQAEGEQGYNPSGENVFFGDYPLRLPFELVTSPGLNQERAAALLEVLYSERVTQQLQAAGFVPIPAQERQSILFTLE